MSLLPATVFIVDDDPSVCRSLSRLVKQAGLVGKAFTSPESFLHALTEPLTRPTCLVVDLQMPGLNGLELQRRLSSSPAACPVIFISGNGDIPSSVQAMRQGAVTFLTKPFDNDDLLRAIAEALEKHRIELHSGAEIRAIQERVNALSDREREVMGWLLTGALNKQIGAKLDIVERTVKIHRARVLQKMQAGSVAELVRLCGVVGFIAAPSE
ncbi:MAG: response regulator transcription factor [Verrucomicrobiaceae bacterium]|nr:response regulator transcription factor [Verrucomicrobiaceae bacterium]